VHVLVANKSDLIDQEQVSYDEARQYANHLGAILKMTSCKENKGVSVLISL
jgi:Ras-related protein Rab-22